MKSDFENAWNDIWRNFDGTPAALNNVYKSLAEKFYRRGVEEGFTRGYEAGKSDGYDEGQSATMIR